MTIITIGKLYCNLTFPLTDEFKADTVSHFEPVEKNGEVHWQMKHLDFDFSISKLYVQLDNLFNGDRALGEY